MSSKKKHNPGKIPPGNQRQRGPGKRTDEGAVTSSERNFQEADPKGRQGDFTNTAEHSIQEPGGKNDANH